MQKQWAAVRGLYNAQADFIYSSAGIFTPEHVGIVQFYGGAGDGASLDEAAEMALRNLAAVRATLANYEQSRLAAPNPLWVEWYLDFVTRRSQNVLALLGHPDPRQTRRGLGRDGEIANDTGDDLAAEQNEILFRGLARLREDFVFQVSAARIGRKRLAEALVRVAQVTSNIASRQRGSLNIGFSLSIPLVAALSSGITGSRSGTDSHSQSTSDGVSQGWGQNHTDSYAHTRSQSSTVGEAETHGIAIGHTDAEELGAQPGAHRQLEHDRIAEHLGRARHHPRQFQQLEPGAVVSNWSDTANRRTGRRAITATGRRASPPTASQKRQSSSGQPPDRSSAKPERHTERQRQRRGERRRGQRQRHGRRIAEPPRPGPRAAPRRAHRSRAPRARARALGRRRLFEHSVGGGSSSQGGGGVVSSVGGGPFHPRGGGSFSSTSDSVSQYAAARPRHAAASDSYRLHLRRSTSAEFGRRVCVRGPNPRLSPRAPPIPMGWPMGARRAGNARTARARRPGRPWDGPPAPASTAVSPAAWCRAFL